MLAKTKARRGRVVSGRLVVPRKSDAAKMLVEVGIVSRGLSGEDRRPLAGMVLTEDTSQGAGRLFCDAGSLLL